MLDSEITDSPLCMSVQSLHSLQSITKTVTDVVIGLSNAKVGESQCPDEDF